MQHFYHKEAITHIKSDVIISCEFDTDLKTENCYHDGEQLLFNEKSTFQNTEQKQGCSCNL